MYPINLPETSILCLFFFNRMVTLRKLYNLIITIMPIVHLIFYLISYKTIEC